MCQLLHNLASIFWTIVLSIALICASIVSTKWSFAAPAAPVSFKESDRGGGEDVVDTQTASITIQNLSLTEQKKEIITNIKTNPQRSVESILAGLVGEDKENTEKPSVTKPTQPEKGYVGMRTVVGEAANLFAQARMSLAEGKYASAEVLLRKSLKRDARHFEAREQLAGLLILHGRIAEAQKIVATGIRLAPEYLGFTHLKARLLAYGNQHPAAISLLEEVEVELWDAAHVEMLAALYQQVGRNSDALPLYQKVVEHKPTHAANWVGMAMTLESLGEKRSALSAYRIALKLPTLSPALRGYAQQKTQMLGRN